MAVLILSSRNHNVTPSGLRRNLLANLITVVILMHSHDLRSRGLLGWVNVRLQQVQLELDDESSKIDGCIKPKKSLCLTPYLLTCSRLCTRYLGVQLLRTQKIGELSLAVHGGVARHGHILRPAPQSVPALRCFDNLLLDVIRQRCNDLQNRHKNRKGHWKARRQVLIPRGAILNTFHENSSLFSTDIGIDWVDPHLAEPINFSLWALRLS